MMWNSDDTVFENSLTAALSDYVNTYVSELPADEELDKMYTLSDKQLKQGLRRLKENKYKRPLWVVHLQRAAVVLIVFSVVMFSLLSVEPVKATFSKIFLEEREECYEVSFIQHGSNNKTEDIDLYAIEIGYIPEGFEIYDVFEEKMYRNYIYMDKDGNYIGIHLATDETFHLVDKDDVVVEYTTINGYEARITSATDDIFTSIIMGNENIEISVCALLDKEEVIKIAESIK